MSWQQQLVHHVKDDQRRHSIEREPFPCLGKSEIEKTPGVTKEGRITGAFARDFDRTQHAATFSGLRRFSSLKRFPDLISLRSYHRKTPVQERSSRRALRTADRREAE